MINDIDHRYLGFGFGFWVLEKSGKDVLQPLIGFSDYVLCC
jgi:hypothetical protein